MNEFRNALVMLVATAILTLVVCLPNMDKPDMNDSDQPTWQIMTADGSSDETRLAPPEFTPASDWAVPVKNHVPVLAGEHPRLIFRKADVTSLRKRAATPEGQVIMSRLQRMLDGPITADFAGLQKTSEDGEDKLAGAFAKQTNGPFTVWHAAGWAFLYQMTGDPQHADKAAAFARRAMAGEANPDNRYTWPGNGQLRAGPALSALALAYDMAYDGWDEATRKETAGGIMANKFLAQIANSPAHGPGCNHWGAHTGGAGIAALALRGDPEADTNTVENLLSKLVFNAKREIFQGYGTRGYYYEGHHCGRLSSNTGLIPFIQAYRVAGGVDLVAQSPNAQWLLTKWMYELVDHPNAGSKHGITYNSRGMYRRAFGRTHGSEGGDFAQGFGICPDKHKPAVLWFYNHILEPGPKTYDVTGAYPHLAAYALANWPLDLKERNPGTSFGRVLFDEGPGYFVFRNGWADSGNVAVTVLLGNLPYGGRGMAAAGQVELCGLGVKRRLPGIFFQCRPTMIKYDKRTGMGVISATPHQSAMRKSGGSNANFPVCGTTSVAVDCSGASGAAALVVMTGPLSSYYTGLWLQVSDLEIDGDGQTPESPVTGAKCTTWKTDIGGRACVVSMLHKGPAPAITFDGPALVIGGQMITCEGDDLKLETLKPTFTWPSKHK